MSGSGALTAVQIALGAANEAIPEEMAAGPIGWALAAATGIADAAVAAMTIYNATNQSKAALKAKSADKATTTCSGDSDGGDPDDETKKARKKVQDRIKQLQDQIPPGAKGRITMGVGVGKNADGTESTLIGTSEPKGYLRPGVTVQPGETIVPGTGHAESDIVNYANSNGISLQSIGATRPVCASCQAAIPPETNIATPTK